MKFCDRLNLYIETLGCSAKTLSAASGISDAAISRYRSGEREPGRDSEQLLRLAQGICAISAESDYSPGFSEDEVLCALRASLHTEKSDFDSAVQNLPRLLRTEKTRKHRGIHHAGLPLCHKAVPEKRPKRSPLRTRRYTRRATYKARAIHCAPHGVAVRREAARCRVRLQISRASRYLRPQ